MRRKIEAVEVIVDDDGKIIIIQEDYEPQQICLQPDQIPLLISHLKEAVEFLNTRKNTSK